MTATMRMDVPATQDQTSLPGWTAADFIYESHVRSASFGLSESDHPDYSTSTGGELRDALEENRFLVRHSAPVMETLYDQIANTHSMVLLASACGMILHSLGDNDFLEKASRVALITGANWSERSKGTNAIGTALFEQQALTVHGDQHYLNANKFLTCSAAPISDPHGNVIGVLDVSGDHRGFHPHTLALVRMSAQMIENHMFADAFSKAVRVHFHSRPEFLGTLMEGIAVFSSDGRFLSANRSAQFQIGLSLSALKAHTFSTLFGMPISSLLEHFNSRLSTPMQLVMLNGVTVWCRAKYKWQTLWAADYAAGATPAAAHTDACNLPIAVQGLSTRNVSPMKPKMLTLRDLDTGDARIASIIQKLRSLAGKDIPIMILGETGVGKDVFAQAIHLESPRARRPFVAVDCASIPETLIESELFGYEEGAFTGAKKKGMAGKILQANGGTLFLDEIGDMPKHLQSRLLRVLQTRRIAPLGAGKEVDVDFAVICATNKNLKDLIVSGDFREDLYYRLNGLVVRLPPLRERSDFEVLVRNILCSLCESEHRISVSSEVMQLLSRYHWPGNLRQLHNLLRTAAAIVGRGGNIEVEHLPDDFLEEVKSTTTTSAKQHLHQISEVHCAQETPPLQNSFAALSAEGGADNVARLRDVTVAAIAQMLRLHKGNVSAAAKALGVSRNTIYRKRHLLPPDVL